MKRAAALVLGAALSLLLGEATVRILGLGTTTLSKGRLHAYDPEAGWICTPGIDARFRKGSSFDVRVTINSRGLRSPERALAKPAGVRRVVVLGDSTVWGHGVENDETLAAVVERLLPGTEAVNLGANGYSNVQSLVRFETEGLRYAPDWTVFVFTPNDLEDNFDDKDGGRPIVALQEDGSIEIRNRPVRTPWKSGAKQWLRHHSRLFGFGEYGTDWLGIRHRQRRAREARAKGQEKVRASRLEEMVFSNSDLYGAPVPAVDRAWLALRGVMARIAELAEGSGGRVLVVYTTGRLGAHPKLLAGELEGRPPSRAAHRPNRRLGAIANALGLPYVDPTPAFRAHPDPQSLFLYRDPHWSAAGLELTSRLVVERIESLDAQSQGR